MKSIEWVGSSKRDILGLPEAVRSEIGFSLFQVQNGIMPEQAKPLKGFGGASVQEIMADHKSDTYRAVYTVRFTAKIYILHVFQKKSKSGTSTPKKDMDLIEKRLKQVVEMESRRTQL
ncbi:MAG: type II toxin-antitoxin system RelE/ParE family toxin [Alphaproteobacteria bacterium]|nr:type II toxin-antitoxin system RelE/ParE family toxin [Alphaproteobacteria bacterium]